MQNNHKLAQEVIGQQMGDMYFSPDKSRFYAASTSVGSGKTRAAIEYMFCAERVLRNFIYVAPTIKLAEQTTQDLINRLSKYDMNIRNVNLIHSQRASNKESASAAALHSINDSLPTIGAIVVLTTTTFLTILPLIQRKDCWHLLSDEAFSPLSFIDYELGKTDREKGREYFDSLFKIEADDNDRVVPATGKYSLVQSVASGDWGQAGTKYQGMQKLAQQVLNNALRVELAKKQQDKYIFASWVTPEYFKEFSEVVFLAALFEQSILYHLWRSMYGIDFGAHRYFKKAIERNVHVSQGELVSVGHILHEDSNASKYNLQRNYETGDPCETKVGRRVIDRAIEYVSQFFSGEKYLLQVNKWTGYTRNTKHEALGDATIIPTYSHGMNAYSEYHAVAALAVTNPTPVQKEWIKKRVALSDKDIYAAFRIHTVYQACGRAAVRDGDNDKPVIFITAGREDAWFLHQLFEGSDWFGQIGDMRKLGKGSCRLADNPAYKMLRKEYKKLKAKEGRRGLNEIEKWCLEMTIKNIEYLKRDNTPK